MELNVGIKHIIDRNAIIIMGAGASYGAKNAFGDFPSGTLLAEELYKKCGIIPDDKTDLQDASQCYEELFQPQVLLQKLEHCSHAVLLQNPMQQFIHYLG